MLNTHRRVSGRGPRSWFSLAILVGWSLSAGSSLASNYVTAVEGVVRTGSAELALHSELADNATIETVGEARVSLLLGESTVLRLGAGARARLGDPTDQGPGRIEIGRGELIATVAARPAGDPFEIHTPAVIITLPGNVVHVFVAPKTGETTLVGVEGSASVKSRDPSKRGSVTVAAGEQLSILPGSAPGQVRPSDPALLAASGIASAAGLRSAAIVSDRSVLARVEHARLAAADVPTTALPSAGASSSASKLIDDLADSGLLDDVCDPINCNPVVSSPSPEPCGPIPGEGCLP